jgi:ribose transport system substrate-binding protein
MRRVIGALATGAMLIVLAACGSDDGDTVGTAPERKGFKIGVASFTLQAPYFIAMSKAVEDEAKAYHNVEMVVTDARGEASQLTSDIENLLSRDVDGVIISGGLAEALPAAMKAIKDKGVPAVLVDRKLKDTEYTSWIGPDNRAIGTQDGDYIAARLGGKGTLLVIKGGPADNTIGRDRTEGMLSVVKQHSGITVVSAPSFGGWSSDGGLKVMENMLAKHPVINAVFCENDAMCLGAQKAIAEARRSRQIFLAGVDGQKEALKAIMDGTNFAVTGVNNSDQIGRAGFNRMMAILAGAQVPKDTVLPSPRVTKDNAAKFYDPSSLF